MTINNLQEKFVFELGAMRDAEERFLEGQHAMLPQASSQQLHMLLRQHIEQTQGHIQVLDTIFNLMGLDVQSNKCDAANGLVMEGSKTAAMITDPYVRDCAITGALAKVEHFEIACYRGLITAAQHTGQEDIVQYLHQNLMEEEQTAQRLEAYMPQVIDEAKQGETTATAL